MGFFCICSERGRLMEGERTRQFARGLGESLAGIRSRGFNQANLLAQQAGTNFLNIGNQLQRQQLAQLGGIQGLGGLKEALSNKDKQVFLMQPIEQH